MSVIDPTDLINWAKEQTQTRIEPLGNRWLHIQGVVQRARSIKHIFNEEDQMYLIAAAYLHDIGYAPDLQKTGFHPINGACFLKSQNQERLASLVAYHSEPQYEAELRGLTEDLNQFEREDSLVRDALTYCDMTTDSTGQQVSFHERLSDIYNRYNPQDIVYQAILKAESAQHSAIERTLQNL